MRPRATFSIAVVAPKDKEAGTSSVGFLAVSERRAHGETAHRNVQREGV